MEKRELEFSKRLEERASERLNRIEGALKAELRRYSSSHYHEPITYALEAGKRLRPLILLLSGEVLGGDVEELLPAAVAVELLHTESIIHDDVIDGEQFRRQRVAFHIKYGYNISLLTADFVFGMILELSSRYKDPRIARELSKAAISMCEGQYLELKVTAVGKRLHWEDYLQLIAQKTASLFSASAKVGAFIAKGSEEQVTALGDYGYNLGIAYQIRDDLLDWEREKVVKSLAMNERGGLRLRLTRMCEHYADRATEALAGLPEGEALALLRDLANYVKLSLVSPS